MKKFIYIAVGIILASSLMPTLNYSAPATALEITLESPEAGEESLLQAKETISRRLTAYGITAFEIKSKPEKRQLFIRIEGNPEVEPVLPLLTSVGKLEFCEVFTRGELLQLFRGGENQDGWQRWLPLDSGEDEHSAVIGSMPEGDIPSFGAFVLQQQAAKALPQSLSFAFGRWPDEAGRRDLYALRYGPGMAPVLTGGAVKDSRAHYDEGAGAASIGLAFNEEGAARWARASRDNISRPIAIVLDGLVYFAPRVMDEIRSGQAVITGDFSREEARQLAALIQGGELPVPFQVKAVEQR